MPITNDPPLATRMRLVRINDSLWTCRVPSTVMVVHSVSVPLMCDVAPTPTTQSGALVSSWYGGDAGGGNGPLPGG